MSVNDRTAPPAGKRSRFFRVDKIRNSPSSKGSEFGLVPLTNLDGSYPIPDSVLGFFLDDYPEGTILEMKVRNLSEEEKTPRDPIIFLGELMVALKRLGIFPEIEFGAGGKAAVYLSGKDVPDTTCQSYSELVTYLKESLQIRVGVVEKTIQDIKKLG